MPENANKIALDLQIGYEQIKELFGGTFYILLEKEYNKKFNNISSAGIKQHTKEDLDSLIILTVNGILWKEKDNIINENISYKSAFAMDVMDVLNAGLEKYSRERLYLVSYESRIKPVQLYNMGQDTIYSIPGPIKNGTYMYDVIFWEVNEVTSTGR